MSEWLYILDENGAPRMVDDVMEWALWFETANTTIVGPHHKTARHVGKDVVGDYEVSTVFLGMNHNWHDEGPPLLWETMVFGPDGTGALDEEYFIRHHCRDDAAKWHEFVVAALRGKEPKK